MKKLDREWEVVSTHKSGSEARSQELAKPTWLNEVDEMEAVRIDKRGSFTQRLYHVSGEKPWSYRRSGTSMPRKEVIETEILTISTQLIK